jgi:hypothetical protein
MARSSGRSRPVDRQQPQVGRQAALTRRLGDTHVREQSVDPRIEPVRIAKARQVPPGDHQRVLQGILGPVDIPKDPLCDREEPVTARAHQVHEGTLVAMLGQLDEIAIHRCTVPVTSIGDVVRPAW